MSAICSACGQTIELADRCPACDEDPLLDGRYRLDAQIGRGASGITFRATRLEDAKVVAIKELSYRAMQSFEMEKLFRREAKVLQQLSHPGIPEYIDDFTVESGKRLSLFLVQEFVDGETLEQEMVSRRYSEAEVLDILDELADILIYLQEVRPAVFHRDIKPANVMRTGDGALVLIDFGSVKATTDSTVGGSTVAGTFGYMAPEQHWGRATPQTDLYAMGALALALLSRRDPSEFVGADHRLDWRAHVDVSEPVEQLLDALLQDQIDARPDDAVAARELIRRTRDRLSQGLTPEPPASPEPTNDWAVDAPRRQQKEAPPTPATSATSPESTHSPNRAKFVALSSAGLVLVVGLIGAMLVIAEPSDHTPAVKIVQQTEPGLGEGSSTGELEAHACKQQECTPLSTPFKDRLEFGMTVVEAREARPELAKDSVEGGVGTPGIRPGQTPSPGTVLAADIAVLDKRARCDFSFFVDDGLSQIDCRISGLSTRTGVNTYSRRLVERLASRYGLPTSISTGDKNNDQFFDSIDQTWQWRRDGASLRVSAELNGALGNLPGMNQDNSAKTLLGEIAAKVRLTHTLDAHDAALDQAAEREADERARKAAERERKRRLEMENLKALSEDDSL